MPSAAPRGVLFGPLRRGGFPEAESAGCLLKLRAPLPQCRVPNSPLALADPTGEIVLGKGRGSFFAGEEVLGGGRQAATGASFMDLQLACSYVARRAGCHLCRRWEADHQLKQSWRSRAKAARLGSPALSGELLLGIKGTAFQRLMTSDGPH